MASCARSRRVPIHHPCGPRPGPLGDSQAPARLSPVTLSRPSAQCQGERAPQTRRFAPQAVQNDLTIKRSIALSVLTHSPARPSRPRRSETADVSEWSPRHPEGVVGIDREVVLLANELIGVPVVREMQVMTGHRVLVRLDTSAVGELDFGPPLKFVATLGSEHVLEWAPVGV